MIDQGGRRSIKKKNTDHFEELDQNVADPRCSPGFRLDIHLRLQTVVSDSRKADTCHCPFFFQAEDGIRYYKVTGFQTCALPISITALACETVDHRLGRVSAGHGRQREHRAIAPSPALFRSAKDHSMRAEDHTRPRIRPIGAAGEGVKLVYAPSPARL